MWMVCWKPHHQHGQNLKSLDTYIGHWRYVRSCTVLIWQSINHFNLSSKNTKSTPKNLTRNYKNASNCTTNTSINLNKFSTLNNAFSHYLIYLLIDYYSSVYSTNHIIYNLFTINLQNNLQCRSRLFVYSSIFLYFVWCWMSINDSVKTRFLREIFEELTLHIMGGDPANSPSEVALEKTSTFLAMDIDSANSAQMLSTRSHHHFPVLTLLRSQNQFTLYWHSKDQNGT